MTQQLIEQAILEKSVIAFTYNSHERIVEPHVLGVQDGKVQFLGYQIDGTSSSGGQLPEWRRFDLAKISGLTITDNKFPGSRPVPSGKHSSWDYVKLVVKL
jgi:predicted DNA-binding transcriptional regulator YafY